jgi:hypothetical protein
MIKKVFIHNSQIFNNQQISKESNNININQHQINTNQALLSTEILEVEDESKKESPIQTNNNDKLLKEKTIKIQIKKQKSIKVPNKK